MTVNTRHPEYLAMAQIWEKLGDAYAGADQVKSKTTKYLPATSGMIQDGYPSGTPGKEMYEAYIMRALFHEYIQEAVTSLVGIMHSEPAKISVPDKLAKMTSADGESLPTVLRKINTLQLLHGRSGIALDVLSGAGPATAVPYIAVYSGPSAINWSVQQSQDDMIVLDESGYVRKNTFEWDYKNQYRVLRLDGGKYTVDLYDTDLKTPVRTTTPQIAGRALTEIPFRFVNPNDLAPSPDGPPLRGLVELVMAIYRGEADYRQTLFHQGQATLVVIGALEEDDQGATRVGAGARLHIPTEGGDAKYIVPSSDGIAEQRLALENDKAQAGQRSMQLLDSRSQSRESGDALTTRMSARVATLNTIALMAAEGMKGVLQQAAIWVGANPDEVDVQPNLDFGDDSFGAKDLVSLMDAVSKKLPLSDKSIHSLLAERDYTSMSFEEEMSRIQESQMDIPDGTTADDIDPGSPT